MNKISTRKSFGMALAELGEKYPQIVCLDADLSKSTQSVFFAKKYPERFFEMGIQEANMIGVAAGLSFAGKIPFICSFAAFITGRYDQIRMSIGYSNANVKIIGTHSGVGIGEDGHSQMGLEDVSLMRAIPNMVVLQPGDHEETNHMMEWAINHPGPVYLRLTRQDLKQFHIKKFTPGIFPLVFKGENSQCAFLATGGLLDVVDSSIQLIEESKRPSLYNMSTLKPLNHDFMSELTKTNRSLIVFEDHSIIGGAGSAIAEWTSEFAPGVQVIRYGVKDLFGESGTPEALYQKHGFTAEAISTFYKKRNLNF